MSRVLKRLSLVTLLAVVIAGTAALTLYLDRRGATPVPPPVINITGGPAVGDLQCGVATGLAAETPADITDNGPAIEGAGVSVDVVASGLPGKPSSIAFHPDGSLYALLRNGAAYPRPFSAALNGRLVLIRDGKAEVVLEGLHDPGGLLFVGDGLYISQLRQIIRLSDVRGTSCTGVQVVLDGLPYDDLHQTNDMAFHDGRVYVSQGYSLHAVPSAPHLNLRGTVFSMLPDGTDVKVYAEGLRNSFNLAFDNTGHLWVADNGPNEGYDEGY